MNSENAAKDAAEMAAKASLLELIAAATAVLRREPIIIAVDDNSLLFGDYLGQNFDFICQQADAESKRTDHVTVFLGGHVDRGEMGLELLVTHPNNTPPNDLALLHREDGLPLKLIVPFFLF